MINEVGFEELEGTGELEKILTKATEMILRDWHVWLLEARNSVLTKFLGCTSDNFLSLPDEEFEFPLENAVNERFLHLACTLRADGVVSSEERSGYFDERWRFVEECVSFSSLRSIAVEWLSRGCPSV